MGLRKLKIFNKTKDIVNKTKMVAYKMGKDCHQPHI